MNPSMTRRQMLATSALALAGQQALAQADTWPNRPIKVIVPSGAGSVADVLARQLYDRLRPILGQPIVIDNRPGANGLLATTAVKSAPPDGHTFLHGTASATVIADALNPALPVQTLRDLAPVALTAVGGVLLVVHPSVPARNLQELVALLKAEPNRYPSYGSWGVGSNGHLTMEWIKQRAGLSIQHVPYKTTGTVMTDLVAGTIHIAWLDVVSPVGFIQQGKLRGIAINGEIRNPKLPDIPTMTDQGFPFPATGWQGVFAPKDTPVAILNRMNAEINRQLATADLQDGMRKANVDSPPIISRDAFAKMVERDHATWRKIVVDGNIKPE